MIFLGMIKQFFFPSFTNTNPAPENESECVFKFELTLDRNGNQEKKHEEWMKLCI